MANLKGSLTRAFLLITSTRILYVMSALPPDLYMGCYKDTIPRDLVYGIRISGQTPLKCLAKCLQLGYMFFGLQDTTECRCDNDYGGVYGLADSSCSYGCQGNSNLKCGGSMINSVYRVETMISQYLGCYKEGTPRDLWGDQSLLDGTLSASEVCVERCKKKGFHFAGVKNYAVCSCGVSFGRYGKANPKDCNPKCSSGEHCSAIDANSIYRTAEANLYIGCYIDNSDRDLSTFVGHFKDNTPITCCARCRVRGYRYCGVQDGNNCFCGNGYGKHGEGANCILSCTGDSSIKCGGVWRNSIYAVEAATEPPPQPGHEYVYTSLQGIAPLTRDHVIYTEKSVRDVYTCSHYCELVPACQSINYDPVTMVCEMNNVTSSVVGPTARGDSSYWAPVKYFVMESP
ncbi:WSC domain-containing protein ARB_07867 [Nematostella vectensis]|uniref:WSC domain-containing protein ARB_07867 n=1 Tax=Nematostella vectensis TaxID=45351 RepID=UPI00138FD7FE|nr:WSC domain-containing protein ARB_07867 [Nematostella vectensis]